MCIPRFVCLLVSHPCCIVCVPPSKICELCAGTPNIVCHPRGRRALCWHATLRLPETGRCTLMSANFTMTFCLDRALTRARVMLVLTSNSLLFLRAHPPARLEFSEHRGPGREPNDWLGATFARQLWWSVLSSLRLSRRLLSMNVSLDARELVLPPAWGRWGSMEPIPHVPATPRYRVPYALHRRSSSPRNYKL